MKKAAILGYGTIGSGVAEVLEKNKAEIAASAGEAIELKYVLDLREFPDSPVADKIVHDFQIIEKDPEVTLVVETMGGLNPAYPFVKACLLAGKHVTTSNKALVAAHGTELLEIARQKHVNFLFEASTGGGIPLLRTIYRSLGGERFRAITAILNGTTNYILTKMAKEGSAFDTALKEAQALGYAERNPEADVEGHDTCRKIAILTAMVTGKEVGFEEIYTEGITKITDMDFRYAEKLGTSIKLLGCSRIKEDRVEAWVAPTMVKAEHPLYMVNDVFNGILCDSNMLGKSMYYGSGAGKLPTASAVVADLIEMTQNFDRNIPIGWTDEHLKIADMADTEHSYFVRIAGSAADSLAAVKAAFGEAEIVELPGENEFAIVTGTMKEREYQEKAASFDVLQMIRAEF